MNKEIIELGVKGLKELYKRVLSNPIAWYGKKKQIKAWKEMQNEKETTDNTGSA